MEEEQTRQWPQDTKRYKSGIRYQRGIRIRKWKKNRQDNGHKIPKRYKSESVNGRRTDKTMAKRRRTDKTMAKIKV